MVSVSLTAWRSAARAVSIAGGNATLVELEALAAGSRLRLRIADVGPTAIEVLLQCRRADVRGAWYIAVERQAW